MKKTMMMLVLLTAVLWLGTAFAGDKKEYHNFMALPIRELSPEQAHASLEEQGLLIELPYDMEGVDFCGYPFRLGIEGGDKVTYIQLNAGGMEKVDEFQEASQALTLQFIDMDELLTARYGTPTRKYSCPVKETVEIWTVDTLLTDLDQRGSYMAHSSWGNVSLRLWLDSEHVQHFAWDEPWDGLRAQITLSYNYR